MFRLMTVIAIFLLSKSGFGQDINLIIQVNGKLVQGGLSNLYATLDSSRGKHFPVDYVPGNLHLPNELWSTLKADSTKPFFLHFTYNTFQRDKQSNLIISVKVNQWHLEQPYLICNVYDFRDKQYRRWYQQNRGQEYVTELNFPNGGILIRNR